jgi:hypothetical protein
MLFVFCGIVAARRAAVEEWMASVRRRDSRTKIALSRYAARHEDEDVR